MFRSIAHRRSTPSSSIPVLILSVVLIPYGSVAEPDVVDANWSGIFAGPGTPGRVFGGQTGSVRAATMYAGQLVIGGLFEEVSGPGTEYLAAWDGTTWQSLGGGLNGQVLALTVLDGELIAAGSFTRAGGVQANRIASWNGSSWRALGSGFDRTVFALAVHEGDLFAGGIFTRSGSTSARRIARWNGSSWSGVGAGTNGAVFALASLTSGLVAGGGFSMAGVDSADHVASWDGVSWSRLGAGTNGKVLAVAAFRGGLVAGGDFSMAGGAEAWHLAFWDGNAWQPFGGFVDDDIHVLLPVGDDLIVGGAFMRASGEAPHHVARWTDAGWQSFGAGTDGPVLALAADGATLYAGGEFLGAGDTQPNNVARWDGTAWSALGAGIGARRSDGRRVTSLLMFQGELIAAGFFPAAGGVLVSNIAAWNGISWRPLGNPVSAVEAIATYRSELIASGYAFDGTGRMFPTILRWNGSGWSPLGNIQGTAYDMLEYQGDLIIAGSFRLPDDPYYNYRSLARWNGSQWSIFDPYEISGAVYAVAIHEGRLVVGGGGPRGGLQVGDVTAPVASWDGTRWLPLGVRDGFVTALISHNHSLIAAGDFDFHGVHDNVARWNGVSWQRLGSGILDAPGFYDASVLTLAVCGGQLIAAGLFENAGGRPAHNIARWNGGDWLPMGQGTDERITVAAASGCSLYVGGSFFHAGGKGASLIGLWSETPPPVSSGHELQAASAPQGIQLSWNVRDDRLVELEEARVERAREPAGAYVDLQARLVPASFMSFVDDDVVPLREYWYRVVLAWPNGEAETLGPVRARFAAGPEATLGKPWAAETEIRVEYSIGAAHTPLRLAIYDVAGRRVRLLAAGWRQPGTYELRWDRCDQSGDPVSRGIYFLHLVAGSTRATQRIVLLQK